MKLSLALSVMVAVLSVSPTSSFQIPTPTFTTKATSTALNVATDATTAANPTTSTFLTPESAKAAMNLVGSPLYAYSIPKLQESASAALDFPNAFGLTVRYAMKASPNAAILSLFHKAGIHIDASSGFEVRRAMKAGIPAENISLSTQELPVDFTTLMDMGVKVNACSLNQLTRIGEAYSGKSQNVGIRVNPGVGSGGFSKSTTSFSKTNVGGPSSSFGIWHELVTGGDAEAIVSKHGLVVERIHTHIGSGSDPEIWQSVASKSLSFCKIWDSVTACNLGGGYKVGRNPDEQTTDLQSIGGPVKEAFEGFKAETGRELTLEIEPGTFLVANAGALVCTVQDKVFTTGEGSHTFLKLDAGMTDVLRPSLYGAIHPITIFPNSGVTADVGSDVEEVVVVGHCCESGDLMTPKPGEPEDLAERPLRAATVGDICVMDGSGAYCSGMSTKNYNSFPEAPEVFVDAKGECYVIRERQPEAKIYEQERQVPDGVF